MRKVRSVAVLLGALGLAFSEPAAGLFTKTYVFKANTRLEVGADVAEGLRLDSVTLKLPEEGPPFAEVVLSNLGSKSRKVGIALALVNGDNHLVAATSGGTKLFPLRPGRQMTYRLVFDGVHREAADAAVFMLAIETSP